MTLEEQIMSFKIHPLVQGTYKNSKTPQNFPFRKFNDPISSLGVQIIALKECHKIPEVLSNVFVLESVSDDGTLII